MRLTCFEKFQTEKKKILIKKLIRSGVFISISLFSRRFHMAMVFRIKCAVCATREYIMRIEFVVR